MMISKVLAAGPTEKAQSKACRRVQKYIPLEGLLRWVINSQRPNHQVDRSSTLRTLPGPI